jgi:hypothetical protein
MAEIVKLQVTKRVKRTGDKEKWYKRVGQLGHHTLLLHNRNLLPRNGNLPLSAILCQYLSEQDYRSTRSSFTVHQETVRFIYSLSEGYIYKGTFSPLLSCIPAAKARPWPLLINFSGLQPPSSPIGSSLS